MTDKRRQYERDSDGATPDEVELRELVDSEMVYLGAMLDVEPPAEVLAAARDRMNAELARRRRMRLPLLRLAGGALAAAIVVAALAGLWPGAGVDSPASNAASYAVNLYDASEDFASVDQADVTVSDEDLANAWLDVAEPVEVADDVEIWSADLGLYADAQGIFAVEEDYEGRG